MRIGSVRIGSVVDIVKFDITDLGQAVGKDVVDEIRSLCPNAEADNGFSCSNHYISVQCHTTSVFN